MAGFTPVVPNLWPVRWMTAGDTVTPGMIVRLTGGAVEVAVSGGTDWIGICVGSAAGGALVPVALFPSAAALMRVGYTATDPTPGDTLDLASGGLTLEASSDVDVTVLEDEGSTLVVAAKPQRLLLLLDEESDLPAQTIANILASTGDDASGTKFLTAGASADVATAVAAAWKTISAAQWTALATITDAKLTDLAALSEAQLTALATITDAQLTDLAALSEAQLTALASIGAAELTDLAAFSEAQLTALATITDAQITDIAAITEAQWTAIAALSTDQIGGLGASNATAADRVPAISEVALAAMGLDRLYVATAPGADASGGDQNVTVTSKTGGFTPAAGDTIVAAITYATGAKTIDDVEVVGTDIAAALVDATGIKATIKQAAGNQSANTYILLIRKVV